MSELRPPLAVFLDQAPASGPYVELAGEDLARAQRNRASLRADENAAPDASYVLVINAYVATEARCARKTLAAQGVSAPSDGISYVGSMTGLAGLISDVYVAEVADAVVIRPIVEDGAVRERIGAVVSSLTVGAVGSRTA